MMETRQNNVQFQRPTFLPMLCSRPSIKNVTLPTKSHQEDTSSSLQSRTDPLSPKISCIGQVKRSNKIVGFPTTTTITPAAHHRYFKLRRLFSGKNLTFSAPTTTTATCSNRSTRGRVKKEEFDNKRSVVVIDVAELDPPLPVVKKTNHGAAAGDKAAESLWKRRSGGVGCQLRSLQIQPNGAHHLKVTTV